MIATLARRPPANEAAQAVCECAHHLRLADVVEDEAGPEAQHDGHGAIAPLHLLIDRAQEESRRRTPPGEANHHQVKSTVLMTEMPIKAFSTLGMPLTLPTTPC